MTRENSIKGILTAITFKYSFVNICKFSDAEPPINEDSVFKNTIENTDKINPLTTAITTAVEEKISASSSLPSPRLLDIALPLP